jgi:hypothetical protein
MVIEEKQTLIKFFEINLIYLFFMFHFFYLILDLLLLKTGKSLVIYF